MKTTFSRRGLIRLVSFLGAIIAVLAAANIIYMKKIERLETSVEAGYSAAIEGLAQSADGISAVLTKGRYVSSPAMMTRLSNELMEQSGQAKSALESLPVYGMGIDNLEKFLSQVGNYASSLSRRATAGEELTDDDRQTVEKLGACAEQLCEDLWELRTKLLTSDVTVSELFANTEGYVAEGFSGIEDGLSGMPKLIYDGPFSDHILERVPLMTKDAEEVSKEEALEKASKALGTDSFRVMECGASEEGRLPSYCFYSEGGRCAVSKNGGYIVYCIKSRNVKESSLSAEDAARRADEYLESLGIEDMERTYYESYNNVCTVNYAYNDGGITCYTDLIKVAVALDNGEILSFDARGFLVNHRERDFGEPKISQSDASDGVSSALTVKKVGLAVIPTDSVEEKLCYELLCRSDDGKDVLVYVNAMTGDEEDILILLNMDGGKLTV